MSQLYAKRLTDYEVKGVGTTGSGRALAGSLVGADVVKNEITAHAVAASTNIPGVQTILEIGGQDSKIIILRDGIVTDFAMNTVCAAGTGSFLDHQAQRLNVPIEEFGPTALKSTNPARIAGRCGVFAESDLIHKQQLGYPVEDLLYGLCQALVRNYLSNLALGKELLPTVSFQGGVATNTGMVKAFEEALNTKIVVPENHQTMGAIGAALLAMEIISSQNVKLNLKAGMLLICDFHLLPVLAQAVQIIVKLSQLLKVWMKFSMLKKSKMLKVISSLAGVEPAVAGI